MTLSVLVIPSILGITTTMARKLIKVIPKKRGRGRPATGKDPLVAFRLPKGGIADLDRWAAANGYSRSEAIRVLIERGIKD